MGKGKGELMKRPTRASANKWACVGAGAWCVAVVLGSVVGGPSVGVAAPCPPSSSTTTVFDPDSTGSTTTTVPSSACEPVTTTTEETTTVSTVPIPLAVVRGTVWHDVDGDGQREDGEPGLQRAQIGIYDARSIYGYVEFASSGADGSFELSAPWANSFGDPRQLRVLTSWEPSPPNVGDDATDSDVVPSGGVIYVTLAPGEQQIDIGLVRDLAVSSFSSASTTTAPTSAATTTTMTAAAPAATKAAATGAGASEPGNPESPVLGPRRGGAANFDGPPAANRPAPASPTTPAAPQTPAFTGAGGAFGLAVGALFVVAGLAWLLVARRAARGAPRH